MVLRSMSTNEVLGNTAAHFFKSGNVLRAEGYDDLAKLKDLFPTDLKIEYDVWYDRNDKDAVHGYCYTDLLNQFLYIRPACTVRVYQTMIDAAQSEITDEGRMLLDKVQTSSDKYRLRKDKSQPKFVVFMAGTNIWNKITDLGRLRNAVNQGAFLKPHPITARPMLAYLKKQFPDRVLGENHSGYNLLEEADIVGVYTNSEMGISAIARDKKVYLFNDKRDMYTFSGLYNAVCPGGAPSKERLLRVLSCKSSGLIPLHAPNPQEYVDGFFKRFEGLNV